MMPVVLCNVGLHEYTHYVYAVSARTAYMGPLAGYRWLKYTKGDH